MPRWMLPHIALFAVLIGVTIGAELPFFALCLVITAWAAGMRFASEMYMREMRQINELFNHYVKTRDEQRGLEREASWRAIEKAKRGQTWTSKR